MVDGVKALRAAGWAAQIVMLSSLGASWPRSLAILACACCACAEGLMREIAKQGLD